MRFSEISAQGAVLPMAPWSYTLLESTKEFKAAVAIVRSGDKWLLGLSTASDDRRDRWCFAGGGIKGKETPLEAAVREAREETGIRCKAISDIIEYGSKKDVAFVACRATRASHEDIRFNSEFAAVIWVTERQMGSLKLYDNVLQLVSRAKKFS